jgi:hypothetical protein
MYDEAQHNMCTTLFSLSMPKTNVSCLPNYHQNYSELIKRVNMIEWISEHPQKAFVDSHKKRMDRDRRNGRRTSVASWSKSKEGKLSILERKVLSKA